MHRAVRRPWSATALAHRSAPRTRSALPLIFRSTTAWSASSPGGRRTRLSLRRAVPTSVRTDRMAGSTAIIGGGLVGGVIARQLRENGRDAVIIKDVGPTDELALPIRTQAVFITAQSRDSHSTVATENLIFVNTGLVKKALAAAHSC